MNQHQRIRLAAVLLLAAASPFVLTFEAHGVEPGSNLLPQPAPYPAEKPLSERGSAFGADCIAEKLKVKEFLALPADQGRLREGVEVARVRAIIPGLAKEEQILHVQKQGPKILATLIDHQDREIPLDAESFVASAPDGCSSGSGCTGGAEGRVACCVWGCSPGDPEFGFDAWIISTCVEL